MDRASSFLHHQGAKSFEELEVLMGQSGDDWDACLREVSEEQATFQPEPSEHKRTPVSGEGPRWCAKEVIGHYLVTERSLNDAVAGLAGVAPPPNPGPTVSEMGAQSTEYEALPLDILREKLSEFFEETVRLIGALRSSENLGATFAHPVFGPLNMKEWLAFHGLHAMDHIRQIERIKTDGGYPKA
ncbi:MAG: DinB family protein [Verrucomicrobiales bacterium]